MRKLMLAWLLLCAVTSAATVPETSKPYSLVRVKLEAGERATVLSASLLPVEVVRTFEGICFTGPPGRYAVLVIGAEDITTKFCEITGGKPVPPNPPGPTPPEPPEPTPPAPTDEVARRLYPLIIAVGDKATAANLAASYRSVLSKLDDKSITSVLAARTALVAANSGLRISVAWKPAIDGMVKELDGVVAVSDLQRVMRGTIAALEAAAK